MKFVCLLQISDSGKEQGKDREKTKKMKGFLIALLALCVSVVAIEFGEY